MKILQVLGGGAWGGGSVVVLAITRALIARGDEVWVITLNPETARHFKQAGAVVVRSPLWFRAINPLDAVTFLQLWVLCLRERFDLVATHTSKGGFLGRLAARLAGVPRIVHHVHGFAFHQFTRPGALRVYLALERFAARACDLIISVSEQHRRLAIELGIKPPGQVRTVLNGIDLEEFQMPERASARRRLGFREDELIIGSAARLSAQKGFEYLIRAFPSVLARFPNARLAIAGDGPLLSELRAEARRAGVERQVTFLGFRRDVTHLLAALDIFAHPSLWEGLSISLMEAMAAGKAIVASDIWGNREMIVDRGNGLLVPPADPARLADALCLLLGDSRLAETLGRQACRDACDRFGVARMVRENVAAYDSVLPGEAHAPAEGEPALSRPLLADSKAKGA